MITMYQLPTGFDLPVSVSPYCTKLELYLRLRGKDYDTAVGNVFKSPNKKVPYVRWPDGSIQADSAEIIARLEQDDGGLDQGISDDDKARGDALVARAQDTLYYACLYARFATPGGWEHQQEIVRGLAPWLLRPILVPVIRNSQVKLCAGKGFSTDADLDRAMAELPPIAEALGDQDFMLGDRPRVADCAVWANLMHTAWTRAPNAPREAVRANKPLMAYIRRVADRAELELPPLA